MTGPKGNGNVSPANFHEDEPTDMSFVQRSEKDVWQTPTDVWKPIDDHIGIDVDPCAGPTTEVGDRNIRPPENGLDAEWEGTAFINPPFSQKEQWLATAVEKYRAGEIDRAFLLTPDSTDVAAWWHEYIVPNCRFTWFAVSRVDFIDPKKGEEVSGVPFNTAISVLGTLPAGLRDEWLDTGDLVMRPADALSQDGGRDG